MSDKNINLIENKNDGHDSISFIQKAKTFSAALLLYTLPALFFLILIQLMGCGKEAYVVGTNEAPQEAPGNFSIPPKIDLILAQDNSASMHQAFSEISSQLPSFLNNLEAKNWDYHFYATPLGTQSNGSFDSFGKYLVSRFDANWLAYNLWKAPFPDADPSNPGMAIPKNYFGGSPTNYGGFLNQGDIRANGDEQGFEAISRILDQSIQSEVGFTRKDAMSAVLVISTGDDNSGVTYCDGSGGVLACSAATTRFDSNGSPYCRVRNNTTKSFTTYPGQRCETFSTTSSSLAGYKAEMTSFIQAGHTADLRMYAAVPFQNETNCRAFGTVKVGSRYQNMTGHLRGKSYPLCNSDISSILESIAQDLQTIKLDFQTRHLVIATEPNLQTVVIYRIRNGVKELIPQNASNGWSYLGYQKNVPAIDHPVPMNNVTGYIFRLNGGSVLRGNDTAHIEFKAAGAQNAY